jgi:hypothetical protein
VINHSESEQIDLLIREANKANPAVVFLLIKVGPAWHPE